MMLSRLLIINIKGLNRVKKYLAVCVSSVLLLACRHKSSFEGATLHNSDALDEHYSVTDHTKESLSTKDFIAWCADKNNHLSKMKEISEMRYHLSYMPAESMAFLELRTEEYDEQKFRTACNHYSDMTYFNFRIECPEAKIELLKYNMSSPQQYEWRVKYISFDMQNDIVLVQGRDTLLPGLYQFERIFEVAPYATVMLAFDNKQFKKDKEFSIVFTDKLFEKGIIKFLYKDQQLINVPNIIGL